MLKLRLTFCIVFCIVFAAAAGGTNGQQPQKEQRSESFPSYEVVNFEIEDAVPIDINNNGEVLLGYELIGPRRMGKFAVWKNGVITRELPDLPSDRRLSPEVGNDQYKFINDKGDVYGYARSVIGDESKRIKLLTTVVKITRNGRRFDWPLPDAQKYILQYSGWGGYVASRHNLAAELSDDLSNLDESLKELADRQRRVAVYLEGDRKNTIDEYIIRSETAPTSKPASYFTKEVHILPKGVFIKGALGILPLRQERFQEVGSNYAA